MWDLFADLVPGRGSEPAVNTSAHTPRWQQQRTAEKATRRREEATDTTCRRCGADVLTGHASGVMPVTLDPPALDTLGYVVAELSGRAIYGVRDNGRGRRTVDDYWPATPDGHLDGVTWHATHRCPSTTDRDTRITEEGNR